MVTTTRLVIAREDGSIVATLLDGSDLRLAGPVKREAILRWLRQASFVAVSTGFRERSVSMAHAITRITREPDDCVLHCRRALATDGRLPSSARLSRRDAPPPSRVIPE